MPGQSERERQVHIFVLKRGSAVGGFLPFIPEMSSLHSLHRMSREAMGFEGHSKDFAPNSFAGGKVLVKCWLSGFGRCRSCAASSGVPGSA